MKINKGILLVIGFLIISFLLLGYFYNDYSKHKQEYSVQKYLDLQFKELFERIEERENLTTTASILLANNKEIKGCLKNDNKQECKKYLKKIQNNFNELSFSKDVKIHIHTKDFRSLFRIWDLNNIKNDSLFSFRESLQKGKKEKKVLWGVEVGRFSLLIRGISPIYENTNYLGSIEAISNFDDITKYFKNKDVDFFVLMNKQYENIASKVSYKETKRFRDFIIVNNINSSIDFMRNIEFEGTGYKKIDNLYIAYTPIYDISNNNVGYYLLKIPVSKIY